MQLKRHQKLKLRRIRSIPRSMLNRSSKYNKFHIKTQEAQSMLDAQRSSSKTREG